MVETLVALAVISVVMASVGTYFVSSMKVSRSQSQIQTANRIAQAGMEQARGVGGPTMLVGRAQCGSCINVSAYDTTGYMADTQHWDAVGAGTPALPIAAGLGETVTVNGINYYRYYFVGKCWQPAAGGICGLNTLLPVRMVRLVVGVTWTSAGCPSSMCIQASTALFSIDPNDPTFTQS
jgi:type II secretory pathway pseudopilin PulG